MPCTTCPLVSYMLQLGRPDRPLVKSLHLVGDCCDDVILVQEYDLVLCWVYVDVHLISWNGNVLQEHIAGRLWASGLTWAW